MTRDEELKPDAQGRSWMDVNVPVDTWAGFVKAVSELRLERRWHYRGTLYCHPLESSLERAAASWGIPESKRPDLERRLLREFQRTFPTQTRIKRPAWNDDLAWLALMQHYGAPTRLLDFTYSPFVAAFFALEKLLETLPEKDYKAAVWALSGDSVDHDVVESLIPEGDLRKQFHAFSRYETVGSFRPVFMDAGHRVRFVTPVNPWRLNERLTVQQGVFLCPGDVSESFEANLEGVRGATDPSNLKRFVLPRAVLREAFDVLRRMNISEASLFPGVEGYARSLRHNMLFLHNLHLYPDTNLRPPTDL